MMTCVLQLRRIAMTPESLPELDTRAFRRAMAAALGLPIDDDQPTRIRPRGAAAWDPLGSVELEELDQPERKAA
jgi:hypothetical protein